jgi:uncharacterized surface protein with fasciclin (FAS1) repeats
MDQSKSVSVSEAVGNRNTGPAKNIVETAVAAGHFTTFAAAVKAAGLTDALSAKGPFTVFAPTDAAFRKLPVGAWDGRGPHHAIGSRRDKRYRPLDRCSHSA